MTADGQIEIQEELPNFKIGIDKVGIRGVRTLAKAVGNNNEHIFVTNISIYLNLNENKRGLHMSRMVDSIGNVIENKSDVVYMGLDYLGKSILDELYDRYNFTRGEIELKTEYVKRERTPVSRGLCDEAYDLVVNVVRENDRTTRSITVCGLGNAVCPHALTNNKYGRSHMQRSNIHLMMTRFDDKKIDIDKMIDCLNKGFSANTYTLVKSVDEQEIINKAYENPKFVEDILRDVVHNCANTFKDVLLFVRVVNEESIHKHNVLAETTVKL